MRSSGQLCAGPRFPLAVAAHPRERAASGGASHTDQPVVSIPPSPFDTDGWRGRILPPEASASFLLRLAAGWLGGERAAPSPGIPESVEEENPLG
jgi:hypothetical protein